MFMSYILVTVRAVYTHWAHDIVATLNQRHWRWFNLRTTSCAQWIDIFQPTRLVKLAILTV